MSSFPTDTIFVEGPDLSGKTTLIENIHNKTNYKWHMMDRSKLSRFIFAEMYNRNHKDLRLEFLKEASNLNNRYVFMLPSFSLLEERYKIRGDKIHTVESLKQSYNLFVREFSKFSRLSNVYAIANGASNRVEDLVINHMSIVENLEIDHLISYVQTFVKNFKNKECNSLSFTIHDNGSFKESNRNILNTKGEEFYYSRIYDSIMRKIDHEKNGINEYNRKEDLNSRRFVFTDDSCISMIHALNRDNCLDMRFVCRSTDIIRKFPSDLRFLYFIAARCWEEIGSNCTSARLNFTLNSAHII